jgi:hypothetical protein
MCEEAVRQDILSKNPVKKVRPPRVIRKEISAYLPETVATILHETINDVLLFPVLIIAIYMALPDLVVHRFAKK